MLYREFWLEACNGDLRHVFAIQKGNGWDGWVLSDEISHQEMIQGYVTRWLFGLWKEVSTEYAEKVLAEDEQKKIRYLRTARLY